MLYVSITYSVYELKNITPRLKRKRFLRAEPVGKELKTEPTRTEK